MSSNKIEVLPAKTLADNGNVAWTIPYINSAGLVTVVVSGTWGSGSAALEFSLDGTVWVGSGLDPLTANGAFVLWAGCKAVRVVLTGATSPSLSVTVGI